MEWLQTRWARWGLYFLAFVVFVLIMDKVVMPWYVDLGDEMEMPDVVQKTLPEAQNQLQQRGFNVIIADSVYDAHFPEGAVVEQNPIAFSTVKQGRNVYLTVSIGEKPIIMPNLFGISPRDAELKLKSLGLNLKTVLYSYSDLYPEGAVIGQSFPQGQEVRKNAQIVITVSLGELPSQRRIPSLVGKSLSAARQQLNQLGISIGEIVYEESESYLPQTVLKQSLAEGTQVGEEAEIDLTVSVLKKEDDQ